MSGIIRKGIREDVPVMFELIKELALYEKAPEQVTNTVEQMYLDGFGDNPIYGTIVAEVAGEVVGLALYYYRYSTWKGKRLGKYLGWRKEIFGHCKDQSIEEDATLRDQIRAGLLYLCPTKLPNGAALIFIRMRHHNPTDFNSHTTMQYWHYMIMTSLIKDPLLAIHGFVFVNNFEGATLANTDIKVPTSISSALNKCMPVRVNSINFVNPPWVIRMVIPVVKTVLSAKLASRLNVILDAAELPEVLSIAQEDLPTELGGQVEVDDPVGVLQIMVAENIAV
eukprot:GDKK01070432.1.p1 GENE.GDKK01070432.1~~GDKK01070432.1.p1  ORF type:complete len:281 (-),score=17.24 GDKK01070432.1:122-964(-)